MPRRHHQPAALRRRIFLGREAIESGLLTAAQLRSERWRRLRRGVYADARLEVDHGLHSHAAALVLPPEAAVTGVSAAWLWGARLAAQDDLVDIVSPRFFGPVSGLRIRTAALPTADVDKLAGVRLTTPARTAWEVALRHDTADAVAIIDALAHLGRIDAPTLAHLLGENAGRPGSRAARRVFGLVDGRAESPQESRLRVRLIQAGLPSPVPQYEVRLGGEFLARVDLAWPDVEVAVEYDGVWHADAAQLRRDRRRLNSLLAAGWLVFHVTAADMRDTSAVVEAIRRLLAARGLK